MPTMDAVAFDRAASLASASVEDLHDSKDVPHAAAGTATAHGWSVVVIVTPAAPGDGIDNLTQCDRDCLALLAQATAPAPARAGDSVGGGTGTSRPQLQRAGEPGMASDTVRTLPQLQATSCSIAASLP
jgi:hypothetical protein